MKISLTACGVCDTPWPHPALTKAKECPLCYAKRTLEDQPPHSKC